MSKDEIQNIIAGCCNDILFIYNGKRSGVTSQVRNFVPTFQVWHGDEIKEYSDVDEVMNDKFYSGKSISELAGMVEFSAT